MKRRRRSDIAAAQYTVHSRCCCGTVTCPLNGQKQRSLNPKFAIKPTKEASDLGAIKDAAGA